MACNAYLADITDPKHRTKRFAFMSGCFSIGFNIGKGLSGVIKEELGFMYNFAFGMLASMLTGAYAVVFLKNSAHARAMRLHKETADEKEGKTNSDEKEEVKQIKEATTQEKLRQLFSLKNIKDGVK